MDIQLHKKWKLSKNDNSELILVMINLALNKDDNEGNRDHERRQRRQEQKLQKERISS